MLRSARSLVLLACALPLLTGCAVSLKGMNPETQEAIRAFEAALPADPAGPNPGLTHAKAIRGLFRGALALQQGKETLAAILSQACAALARSGNDVVTTLRD